MQLRVKNLTTFFSQAFLVFHSMVKVGAWNHDLLQRRGLFFFWAAMKGEEQWVKLAVKEGVDESRAGGITTTKKLLDRSHPLKLEMGSLRTLFIS